MRVCMYVYVYVSRISEIKKHISVLHRLLRYGVLDLKYT